MSYDKITIETKGIPELLKAFENFGDKMQQTIARKAVREASKLMLLPAKMMAPKATGMMSGDIGIQFNTKEWKSRERNVGLGGGIIEYKVGLSKLTAWRGKWIEFGTVKMGARPFMRPAFEQTEGAMLDKIQSVLNAEIEKCTAKELARANLLRDIEEDTYIGG